MPRTSTSSEVASALGLSAATVQRYARDKRIPYALTAGGHRRFDIEEVRAVLDSEGAQAASGRKPTATAVILTALQVEATAVLAELGSTSVRRLANGTRYYVGSVEGDSINWSVAVAEIGDGNLTAAAEATRAIEVFMPDVVLFVGIAGSLKSDVMHGTVVVANKVYRYHGGKAADEFLSRPLTFPTWHGLEQLVRQVRQGSWSDVEPRPLVELKPIAAGEVVVASTQSETFRLLYERCNDAVAVDMESAGVYEAAHRAGGVAALAVRGISDMVADKAPENDQMWQPRASANAARFALALLTAAHPDDVALRRAQLPHPNEIAELRSGVPPLTAVHLERAGLAAGEVRDILRCLSRADNPSGAVEQARNLTAQLDDTNGEVGLALAEYAAAHGLNMQAASAFEVVATRSTNPSTWLARAALEQAKCGDTEAARLLLHRAAELASSPEESAYVAVLAAAVEEDAGAIADASARYDGSDPLIAVLRARALDVQGHSDEAADFAMTALRDLTPGASIGGLALEAARLLLVRAEVGTASRGAAHLADRARQLALEVRDWRREWNGPSEEAVVVAIQAAVASQDFGAATRLGLRAPKGEAVNREADHPEVISLAAKAAAAAGLVSEARALAARLDDHAERNLIEAHCLELEGRSNEAVPLLRAALEHAATDEQRATAYMALSGAGDWPLAGLDEFEVRQPEQAQIIRGYAEVTRGDRQAAIRRLRGVDGEQALALLVGAYMEEGRPDEAVEALVAAADRRGKPHLRLRAATLLASEARFEEALALASAGLTHAPAGSHLHREFRRLCIRLAGTLRRWQEMVEQARSALEEGDDSPDVGWALVGGLHNLRQKDAARHEVRSRDLEARSEQEALLVIDLLRTGQPTSDDVAKVLDLAERFSDSEPAMASAFMAFFEMSHALELPEDVGSRIGPLTEAFFEHWPESRMITRIDTSDLDNLVDYMRHTFGQPQPELEEILAKAHRGQVPLGLAAAVRGRSLGTLLVTNALGLIPVGTVDVNQRETERLAALEALERPVVIDTHALFVTGHLGFAATELTSHFSRVLMARHTLDDLMSSASSLSMRSTATLGWHAASDRPSLTEIPENLADRWANEADELAARARQCTIRDVEVRQSRTDDERLGIVLAPLELARSTGCALWSDDPAVRIVAASESIPTFGTSALLAALVSKSEFTELRRRSAVLEIAQAGAVDLPFDTDLLLELAKRELWNANAAALQLSRPMLWFDAATGLRAYQGCIVGAAETAPSEVANWAMSACLGACRAIALHLRPEIMATLVLSGFMHLGMRSKYLPELLKGAREAAPELELSDPLPAVASMLRELVKEEVDESLAPQMFAAMIVNLDDTDRMLALSAFLR